LAARFQKIFLWLAVSLVLCAPAHAAVWSVRAQWDEAAEQQFSQWLTTRVDAEFFYEGTAWSDLAMDCADAVYALRIVFAFEQGLPFVIRDPERAGSLISQATTRFDHVPAGVPRVRAFIDWISGITSTRSLQQDTYPVTLNAQSLQPGVIYLHSGKHVVMIREVRADGVMRYLEATTPRAVRPMRDMLGLPVFVPGQAGNPKGSDGYRRFRHPQHYGLNAASLPLYGEDQYELARSVNLDLIAFQQAVQALLATQAEQGWQKVRRHLVLLCQLAWDRADAVDEAQQRLREVRAQGQRCLGPADASEHSTPQRDQQLLRVAQYVLRLLDEPVGPQHQSWPPQTLRYWYFLLHLGGRLDTAKIEAVQAQYLQWCDVARIEGGPDRPMNLTDMVRLLQAGQLASDPNASLRQRWGLEPYRPQCAGARPAHNVGR
jgi:hypothetical protein